MVASAKLLYPLCYLSIAKLFRRISDGLDLFELAVPSLFFFFTELELSENPQP